MTSPCTPIDRIARRHDLVFVNTEGWKAMLAGGSDLAREPLMARWTEEGWPAIRRRPMPDELSGMALGVPLPSNAGKKRLCLLLKSNDDISVSRPPSLQEAYAVVPSAWQPTLDRLGDLSSRHSVEARVFGSLAWRALRGLDYLTTTSDLDLLVDIAGDTDPEALSTELAAIEADAPTRLDGELMRDDGAAVNRREFQAGAAQVLVKHIDGIALLHRRDFFSGTLVS